jgi:hypothetical protein
VNTEPSPSTPTIAAVERPEPPRHDAQHPEHAYQAYVACFTDTTQALLHLSHTAGIAVAYMDRGYIEAERGGPLTDEQWEELTYHLDEYDDHVSFDDTNSLFLDQIFSNANIPRHPETEGEDDENEDDADDLDDDFDDLWTTWIGDEDELGDEELYSHDELDDDRDAPRLA